MKKILNILTLKSPKERIIVILCGLFILRIIPIKSFGCINLCLWEHIFGNTNHYSHGITRAISALLKGDMQLAYSYNNLVYIVMVIILTLLVIDIAKLIKTYQCKKT